MEYIVRLGLFDRYKHKHIKEKGEILYFCVQYETMVEGKWYPVVRYDVSHGFAHRDLMNIKGEFVKTPLFIQDYNDALTFAESDLKANWELYKERFLREEKSMEKKMIEKNIELSAEFSRFLFEHPKFEEKIPLGTEIILLPEFDLELKKYNLELGKKLETTGVKVIYIKIERLKPKALSRIEGVSLQSAVG